MDMKQSREFRIGAFVLIVLALSFFVINFLRGKDIFNKEMTLVSSYDTIEGLVPSDPVYIKGFKAGSVTDIEFNPETDMFDVTCSVLKKFNIPADSRMTIYSRDIMGGKAVRIDTGSSSSMAGEGSRLAPCIEPDMLASLSGQMAPLLAKVTATAENLDSVVRSVNAILGEENRQDLRSIIRNLDSTMEQAARVSAAIGGKSQELEDFIDNIVSVSTRLDAISEKADSAMGNIGAVTQALSRSDIEGLVVSFKSLLENMQDPDGTLGKLITDGRMYESLDSLVSDADSLLRKIQENPKKYIKISLF